MHRKLIVVAVVALFAALIVLLRRRARGLPRVPSRATGQATLTNVLTGESIIVNISGPGNFTLYQDGSATLVGTGLWSWFGDPDSDAPGL